MLQSAATIQTWWRGCLARRRARQEAAIRRLLHHSKALNAGIATGQQTNRRLQRELNQLQEDPQTYLQAEIAKERRRLEEIVHKGVSHIF